MSGRPAVLVSMVLFAACRPPSPLAKEPAFDFDARATPTVAAFSREATLLSRARLRVGPGDKGVIAIALHGTFVPGQTSNLQTLIGLSAGFSWAVFER